MNSELNLGRILGIQFRLHYSWFIIFILVTVFLAWQVFPPNLPNQSQPVYWAMGTITSLLFFASVLAHELAHSIVGRAHGIPIKSITLFIFGGAAHMTREADKASDELKMAVAGPISSLLIAAIFWIIYTSSISFGPSNGVTNQLALMALWLAQINVVLAVFNLLPGFPLDGGRVLRSLVWHFSGSYKRATKMATQAGRGVGYLIILGGITIVFLYGDWLAGFWLALIGFFLESTARASYRQSQLQELLKGFTASQVMVSDCRLVPGEVTVSQLVQEYATSSDKCLLVTDQGRAGGVLALHNIKSISPKDRDKTRLRDIARPLNRLPVAHPDQDVLAIVQQMNETDIDLMPVVSGGRVIGLITLDNLIAFVNSQDEFRI